MPRSLKRDATDLPGVQGNSQSIRFKTTPDGAPCLLEATIGRGT